MISEDIKKELEKFKPSEDDKRTNILSQVFYVAVFLLVGVPVWVLTTSTYRAPLPKSDIEKLSSAKTTIKIEFNIINFDKSIEDKEIKQFEKIKEYHFKESDFISYKFNVNIRHALEKELEAYKQLINTSIDVFENKVKYTDTDAVNIFIVPKNCQIVPINKVGLLRNRPDKSIFYLRNSDSNMQENIKILHSLLLDVVLYHDFHKIAQEIKEPYGSNKRKSKSSTLSKVGYNVKDLTFSLLIPYPNKYSTKRPEWDFPDLNKRFLDPLLQQIKCYLNISVSSQIIYGERLENLWPSKTRNDGSTFYTKEDLTHVVNGLERILGNTGSLHLVSYIVTSPVTSTLNFVDDNNNRDRANIDTFMVPNWGGVVLLNNVTLASKDDVINADHRDGKMIMRAFLAQIRQLLTLTFDRDRITKQNIEINNELENHYLTMWDIQLWLRLRIVQNIANVQVTLASVNDLLDKVSNMVIRNDVAESISIGTSKALEALDLLDEEDDVNKNNSNLERAFQLSVEALDAAELAFFHPTLLELLYFEDEQKRGIYIPLFVPIGIFSILDIYSLIRYFMGSKPKMD